MNEKEKTVLWGKIKEIRDNWGIPSKLNELLEDWELMYGKEYYKISKEILAEKVKNQYSLIGVKSKSTTANELVGMMWEEWTEGEFTIDREQGKIQIYCTKCPIADSYISIGKADLGLIFQCSEDPHIVSGYNPNIKFTRTKTLMDGNDCCDHCYYDSSLL